MANQITGRVFSIGNTQSIPTKSGNPFLKREIVLDTTRFDPYTGERDKFENYPMFEFNGEKCKDLDGYQVGQVVTISFDLQGAFVEDKEGNKRNFTRVRGYKIEARTAVQPQPQQQAQPQAEPVAKPIQPQPQPQMYQPQATPPPPTMNDLPF